MKLTIIRIENHVVTCELEDCGLINIDKKWFAKDIKENDVIDIDVSQ